MDAQGVQPGGLRAAVVNGLRTGSSIGGATQCRCLSNAKLANGGHFSHKTDRKGSHKDKMIPSWVRTLDPPPLSPGTHPPTHTLSPPLDPILLSFGPFCTNQPTTTILIFVPSRTVNPVVACAGSLCAAGNGGSVDYEREESGHLLEPGWREVEGSRCVACCGGPTQRRWLHQRARHIQRRARSLCQISRDVPQVRPSALSNTLSAAIPISECPCGGATSALQRCRGCLAGAIIRGRGVQTIVHRTSPSRDTPLQILHSVVATLPPFPGTGCTTLCTTRIGT
jgi:hypothetical protein